MQRAFRRAAVALRQPALVRSNGASTQVSVITGSGFQTFGTAQCAVNGVLFQNNLMQKRSFCSDKDFEPTRTPASSYEELEVKLKDLVTANKVVLFMKGSPEAPQCGFSATVGRILEAERVSDFTYVNVLANNDVREAVKKFSDWPTIPQLKKNLKKKFNSETKLKIVFHLCFLISFRQKSFQKFRFN